MEAHAKALQKAKISLMSRPDTTFFTTLLLSFHQVWADNDHPVWQALPPDWEPTLAVDGKTLYIHPDFFLSLSEEERIGVLLHEVLHVAYLHVTPRRGNRDPVLWNMAGDYVINDVILLRKFQLPKGALHDPRYRGLSTEQVYDLLNQNPPPAKKLPMCDVLPGTDADASEAEKQQFQREMDDLLVRAALQSKLNHDNPGSIPEQLQIYLDSLLNPKLPWHTLLRRFLTSSKRDDYSFRKLNRRYLPRHFLPGLYSEGLGHLAWAVDTSGSVTDEQFQQFVSEGAAILRYEKPAGMTLLQFNTVIHSIDEIKDLADLKQVRFSGRGGTDINPVIVWAREHKPKLLLIFTDGEFRLHEPDPGIPILWIITDNPRFTAPYGQVVHYNT